MVRKNDIVDLVGKTVSVLYDNGTREKANQNGKLTEVTEGVIKLDPRNSKYKIESIVMPLDRIVSIWVLGENE